MNTGFDYQEIKELIKKFGIFVDQYNELLYKYTSAPDVQKEIECILEKIKKLLQKDGILR